MYQPTLKNRYKHVEIISFECPFVSVLFFKTLLSNKGYREEPRARSENPGGLVVLGGDNVSPLVEIGLTDPPKASPASHLAACLKHTQVFRFTYVLICSVDLLVLDTLNSNFDFPSFLIISQKSNSVKSQNSKVITGLF